MNNEERLAQAALDLLISKSRVHLYKPIQIAEILYRARVYKDIDTANLSSYRTKSKQWRDDVSVRLVGSKSTSSAKFQDDLFNDTAIPPSTLSVLSRINKDGLVENYIYNRFRSKYSQLGRALSYCINNTPEEFNLVEFLGNFWAEPGLRRSIDKIYEIVVYSLFSNLVDAIGVTIEISINDPESEIFNEFQDFAKSILCLSNDESHIKIPARIFRVGVTNAADRGLDMWANFGMAIQIKHLSLTEELAENIVSSIMADRIVIVCKDGERNLILSLLNQLGWRSRIQSIVSESDLNRWYEKALKGRFSESIGAPVIKTISEQINLEFPSTDTAEIDQFYNDRGYSTNIIENLF